MLQFKLPDIGEGVVEAEVVAWSVRLGEHVSENQPLVELLTDKVALEIPSPTSGRITRICFEPGQIARVGDVLFEIDEDASAQPVAETALPGPSARPIARAASDPVTADTSPNQRKPAPAKPLVPKPIGPARGDVAPASHPPEMPPRPTSTQLATHRPEPKTRATPAVRALAKQLGLTLDSIVGTGPGERILRADVEAAAARLHTSTTLSASEAIASSPEAGAESLPDPADWQRRPLLGVRRTIARRMHESVQRAAHFTYVDELDLSRLLECNEALGARGLSPLAYIAAAVVRALPHFPILNASIDDARGEIIEKREIHLGIATCVGEDLVVPVIHHAGSYDARVLAEEIERLAQAARARKLSRSEMTGGTFTISSLGKFGGLVATPILNPPESAILAVNKLRLEPRCFEGAIVPRSVLNLSISVDHRIADGMLAALFVQALREILENAQFPELFSEVSV